jgi:hypothetical protein
MNQPRLVLDEIITAEEEMKIQEGLRTNCLLIIPSTPAPNKLVDDVRREVINVDGNEESELAQSLILFIKEESLTRSRLIEISL